MSATTFPSCFEEGWQPKADGVVQRRDVFLGRRHLFSRRAAVVSLTSALILSPNLPSEYLRRARLPCPSRTMKSSVLSPQLLPRKSNVPTAAKPFTGTLTKTPISQKPTATSSPLEMPTQFLAIPNIARIMMRYYKNASGVKPTPRRRLLAGRFLQVIPARKLNRRVREMQTGGGLTETGLAFMEFF